MRNTDADWIAMAKQDPYHAVLTAPEFLDVNLTDQAKALFFQTGVQDIDSILGMIRAHIAPGFSPRRALDFGSGVGRLSIAMSDHVEEVVGIEISPAMIAEARRNCEERATGRNIQFFHHVPEGLVDWVSSLLVLQHIPPTVGIGIVRTLLSRLAPGGVVSLQFTAYRDLNNLHSALQEARYMRFDGQSLEVIEELAAPEGRMSMFDYDMTAVLAAYATAGVRETWVSHVDHGGHHAFWVIGRRD